MATWLAVCTLELSLHRLDNNSSFNTFPQDLGGACETDLFTPTLQLLKRSHHRAYAVSIKVQYRLDMKLFTQLFTLEVSVSPPYYSDG